MALEAPISKFKKNNLRIYIVVLLLLAAWCTYDGYFNDDWIQKHTDDNGQPEVYLVFNRYASPILVAGAALLAICLIITQKNKIIADENELVLSEKKSIAYDTIEKIDKTNFESKGYFTITYKNQKGSEAKLKLSDRRYDNLTAVLDHMVAKIS